MFGGSDTLLCLDRWAEIMGINPVAFNGAEMGCICYKTCSKCQEIWYQHDWQSPNGSLSRSGLSWAIKDAERDIANFLGVPLCPQMRCKVMPYRPECLVSSGAVGQFDLFSSGYRNDYYSRVNGHAFYRPGYDLNQCPALFLPRAVEDLMCTACQVDDEILILDDSGNPYVNDNTHCPLSVVITCRVARPEGGYPVPIEACQIFLRHQGSGEVICRPRQVQVTFDDDTGDDVIQVVVDPWLLIEPALRSAVGPFLPTGDNSCDVHTIDLLDPDNLVDCVDIWRRYHDPGLPMVEFGYEPKGVCGCGSEECDICTPIYIPGCVVQGTRSSQSVVLVQPASWNETLGKWCRDDSLGACAPQPDFVKFHYWTGYLPKGQCPPIQPCEVDCSEMERLIAILATARLSRQICTCQCDRKYWWEELQVNTARSSRESGSYFNTAALAGNPFGTRQGEIDVYRRLDLIKRELCSGYVSSAAL
jgi:hypothetical protein